MLLVNLRAELPPLLLGVDPAHSGSGHTHERNAHAKHSPREGVQR